VFETVMHPAWQWGLLFGLSLLPALIIEFGKFLRASRKKVPGTVSPEE
jgi:hypothetical protein